MKDYIIIALIQSILEFVFSFPYVFFVEIDEDEKRYYHDNGKKVPLEWLRHNNDRNLYDPLFKLIVIIIPYLITIIIVEDFMGMTVKKPFYILVFSYVMLFLIYPLTYAIYNVFKKRGKLKYKKFKFEDISNKKDS